MNFRSVTWRTQDDGNCAKSVPRVGCEETDDAAGTKASLALLRVLLLKLRMKLSLSQKFCGMRL